MPKTLPINDVKKLLKTVSHSYNNEDSEYKIFHGIRDTAIIDLLICTGIRIGEASAISLDDIIESEKTMLIHGKGRKQRLIYISCDETWSNLKKWLNIREKMNVSTNKLFVNKNGNQLGIHGIEYIYKKIKKVYF